MRPHLRQVSAPGSGSTLFLAPLCSYSPGILPPSLLTPSSSATEQASDPLWALASPRAPLGLERVIRPIQRSLLKSAQPQACLQMLLEGSR